jgi:cytochrome c-type biogenesis protein
MAHLSLLALLGAFVAGVLSFLSPCILPLTPIYLAQLVGPAIWQEQHDATRTIPRSGKPRPPGAPGAPAMISVRTLVRRATMIHAVAFVSGFSLVFICLGATASVIGAFLSAHAELLRRVGGIVLVAFGLHIVGVVRMPGIDRELRFAPVSPRASSMRGGPSCSPFSFVVGLIFGLGWTPCVGPLLAGILLLAAQAATLASGVLLLAAYSLGLGVPFLGLALAFDRLAPTLKRLMPHLRRIEIGTGVLLVLIGFVIFFNWLIYPSAWVRLPSLSLP